MSPVLVGRDVLLTTLLSTSNLDEPVPNANRPETALGATITFIILAWACGLFRLYTRFFITSSPGWDDLFLALAMLFGLVGAVSISIATKDGLGQHYILLDVDTMNAFLLDFYIANSSYIMATAMIKISLLLQYLRVFEQRIMRQTCLTLLVLVSIWILVFGVLIYVPCNPVSDYWNTVARSGDASCWGFASSYKGPFVTTYISHAAINVTLDIAVLSLPIVLLWKSNSTLTTRLSLLSVLCAGFLAVIVSIWRLSTLVAHKATTYPTFDPTWYSPTSSILATIEVDIATVCASVPVFWPVLLDSVSERIFVTKEVQIIHEEADGTGDEVELRPRAGTGSKNKFGLTFLEDADHEKGFETQVSVQRHGEMNAGSRDVMLNGENDSVRRMTSRLEMQKYSATEGQGKMLSINLSDSPFLDQAKI